MSAQYLTDAELVAKATEHAQSVMYWRKRADRICGAHAIDRLDRQIARASRRLYLLRARQAEARVVECAIVAEHRCIREARL